LSSATRNANLQLLATSKRRGNRNENLATNLDSGEYVVRVLGRSGTSRYRLQVAATAIILPPPPPPPVDTTAPTVSLSATAPVKGASIYDLTVIYSDDIALDANSFDNNDIQVIGPSGFSQMATRVPGNVSTNGNSRTVVYQITAPGGAWDGGDNGSYSIALKTDQVSDTSGKFAAAVNLGDFLVDFPRRTLQYSGTSDSPGIDPSDFEVEISQQDSDSRDEVGVFNKAIPKITFGFVEDLDNGVEALGSNRLTLTNGSIIASDLLSSDVKALSDYYLANNGIGISREFSLTDFNLDFDPYGENTSRYSNGGVKYEVLFDNQPEVTKLVFFVPLPNSDPSVRFSYINSLSNFLDDSGNFRYLQGFAFGRNPASGHLVGEAYGIIGGADPIGLAT
jgi:hypothetical protein